MAGDSVSLTANERNVRGSYLLVSKQTKSIQTHGVHILRCDNVLPSQGSAPIAPGADLDGGGVTRVTSHPPPGAAAYFMLLLCM